YGLKSTETCYLKTKAWINNNDDFLQPIPGLREALENLQREKTILLATNSDAQDTESILSNLNLKGVFQEIYTSCNKPEKSYQLFKDIMEKYECSSEQLISIGDNYLNEIGPVIQLGGEAVLIDREAAFSKEDISGQIIDSIEDLIPIFNQIIK
ncbi:MAG: HAD family hydrolase, partial [Halarsenatibacteraceae bacterium]